MKVTIERSALAKALGHVQSVVERRNTIPILSNVLLRAEGGALTLTATDLDIRVALSVSAVVSGDGQTTVPALALHKIVKMLPADARIILSLVQDESRLKIDAGRYEGSLAVLPAGDFPALRAEDKTPLNFVIPAADLARLFGKARFAMSQEETRYYLNGVYLHPYTEGGAKLIRAAATDGHRLARLNALLPAGADRMTGVIVPRKAVNNLCGLLKGERGDVAVSVFSDGKVRFGFGAGHLTSKLIDGSFPDYERCIPKSNPRTLRVDTDELVPAVKRLSMSASDRTRSINLALGADRLRLTVNDHEAGSALEELSVDYSGDPIEIGFNARYLHEVAAQIEGPVMTMRLSDPASPAVIADENDTSALYVLMPLRV